MTLSKRRREVAKAVDALSQAKPKPTKEELKMLHDLENEMETYSKKTNEIKGEINSYSANSLKPSGDKDTFEALLKRAVQPSTIPPEDDTSDPS